MKVWNDFEYEVKENGEVKITSYIGKDTFIPLLSGDYIRMIKDGKIKNVKLTPSTITEIGNNAFSNCDSIKFVEIPNSVTKIGDSAFEDCYELKTIVIPNSVTEIRRCTFQNCRNLKSVVIPPNSVKTIGYHAFSNCYNLHRIATINSSVTKIEKTAFLNYHKYIVQYPIPYELT